MRAPVATQKCERLATVVGEVMSILLILRTKVHAKALAAGEVRRLEGMTTRLSVP